jgi:hypothetical protein
MGLDAMTVGIFIGWIIMPIGVQGVHYDHAAFFPWTTAKVFPGKATAAFHGYTDAPLGITKAEVESDLCAINPHDGTPHMIHETYVLAGYFDNMAGLRVDPFATIIQGVLIPYIVITAIDPLGEFKNCNHAALRIGVALR